MQKQMETIEVDASALRQLLNAILGPPHYIRELQVTRGLPMGSNPIDTLVNQYNTAFKVFHSDANHVTEESKADATAKPT